VHSGKLADVAPTILKMLGVAQPSEMTGQPLF
jgi:2,3-bisphosphoglycerate-independent phosphoglycerate mutase